ncbi:hypothetical protein [Pontibacter sp. H249]|uniref:hypothetical protein n=1 Tax=Pontibacter sp. H249 TaxID=3133420 RepID=UPI0030BDF896
MNLEFFNTHSHAGRLEIIWAHGTFLAQRGRRGYRIALYDLGNFFAEVWTNPDTDYISMVRGYKSKKALEPYLAKISLESMLEW